MTEIIKVTEKDGQQVVSARDLHKFLGVGKDFSTWFKDKVEKYGFLENQDYTSIYFDFKGVELPKNR